MKTHRTEHFPTYCDGSGTPLNDSVCRLWILVPVFSDTVVVCTAPVTQRLQEGDGGAAPKHHDISDTVIANHYSLVRNVIEVEAHGEVRGLRTLQ
jgi:hypothetical protein